MAMIQQSYPAEELGRILGVLNSLLNLAGPIGLIFGLCPYNWCKF